MAVATVTGGKPLDERTRHVQSESGNVRSGHGVRKFSYYYGVSEKWESAVNFVSFMYVYITRKSLVADEMKMKKKKRNAVEAESMKKCGLPRRGLISLTRHLSALFPRPGAHTHTGTQTHTCNGDPP